MKQLIRKITTRKDMLIDGGCRSFREWRRSPELHIYGDTMSGEIWTEKDRGYIWDVNIKDITEELRKQGKEISTDNINSYLLSVYEGFPIPRLYKGCCLGARDRYKKNPEYYEHKNRYRERSREIAMIKDKKPSGKMAKECSKYLKDIPRLWESDRELNKDEFERLCYLQCTKEEICFWFGCGGNALQEWCKYAYGMTFKEIFEIKRQGGFLSLRRSQFIMAQNVPSVNKFLSVNYLGLSDNPKKESEENSKIDRLIEAIKGVE